MHKVVSLVLVRTTLDQQPHYLLVALSACDQQRSAIQAAVGWPVSVDTLVIDLITLHFVGIGTLVEKALHSDDVAIEAHLMEVQRCLLGFGPVRGE